MFCELGSSRLSNSVDYSAVDDSSLDNTYVGIVLVTCSSAIFKSLIDVITFIYETQVFICDNSNFINSPLYTSIYIQAVSREDLLISRGIPIYIYTSLSHDCDMSLIGYFLMGTSIMYANSAVMHIMTYITLSWL